MKSKNFCFGRKEKILILVIMASTILIPVIFTIQKMNFWKQKITVETQAKNSFDTTVKVYAQNNNQPFSFLDKNGNPSGYEVELLNEIANIVAFNVEIIFDTKENCLYALKNGTADLIMGYESNSTTAPGEFEICKTAYPDYVKLIKEKKLESIYGLFTLQDFENNYIGYAAKKQNKNLILQIDTLKHLLIDQGKVETLQKKWFIDYNLNLSILDLFKNYPAFYITYIICFIFILLIFFLMERIITYQNYVVTNAESSNKSKSIFLTNMSHDIRTPMNAIMGYTKLTKKDYDKPEKVLTYMNKAETASNHLILLVNNILDMENITSGGILLNEHQENLESLLKQIEDIVLSDVQEKNLTFTVDTSDILHKNVICDKLRLNQILINIISNSITYTPEGGHINVSASEINQISENCCEYQIIIKDDGIGIKQDFLKIIFEPFTQEKRKLFPTSHGSGLGLTLTKQIVSLMKGKIDIKSEEGKGTETTVTFQFNLSGKQKTENQTEIPNKINLNGLKVLLVDDNDFNRDITKLILVDEGIIVDEADNGEVAVNKIKNSKKGQYDLVLMDIQMPVMDGYKATQLIRDLDNYDQANIPIIAMTANAFDEDRQAAFEAGMNEHLSKPLEISKLLETLNRFWRNGF